jgi:hypothetical protein
VVDAGESAVVAGAVATVVAAELASAAAARGFELEAAPVPRCDSHTAALSTRTTAQASRIRLTNTT